MNKEEIEELKDFTIDLTDIDELALGLEVCSKKSNMVIQEFADTIIQLQQENKQLKEIIDKSIEINKQIKEFVYNEMVDRCVPGSTELYELVKEELKILKGGDRNE